jgi:hypothetical protein
MTAISAESQSPAEENDRGLVHSGLFLAQPLNGSQEMSS